MKIDRLTSFTYDASSADNLSYTTSRGKMNGLLFSFASTLVQDLTHIRISAKLRHKKGVHVLINRLTALELALISQIKGGYFSTMGVAGAVKHLIDTIAANDAVALPAANQAALLDRLGDVDASWFVDLGHVTLGDAELEITIESSSYAGASARIMDIYSYHRNLMPDTYKIYDESYDREQQHNFVRDVFVMHADPVPAGVIADPIVSLDVDFQIDGDSSYLFDIRSAVAMTNLFTNLEDSGASLAALIFSEYDALPASLYLKMSGPNRESLKFIICKEILVQEKVSNSTLENLEALQKKVAKLEREFPDIAKAYRHAGAIEKSSTLDAVKKQVETSNEDDKKAANV